MNDGAFEAGFIIGLVLAIVCAFVVYHLGESKCQRDNNAADCVYTDVPFLPYVPEGQNEDQ